ncbi:hypothetical protein CFC21_061275 [Triticum aestivum]|uniref:DUF868 domain-containing protein n=2 Tax=Triticum aestivum TaxID=4565 RepID=A0A3B6JGH2_WHEAT|nr:uncharacterized protein LOC123096637 [Triticum aestivum]KAF7053314.1 hypothetical protein CFC21_061275 [Triticum aestivum]
MVSASSLLLLPSSVRDLASCVVADVAACTTPSSTLTSPASPSTLSVTVFYRATALLPGQSSPAHLRLTWTRSPLGPTLSFSPSASSPAVVLRRRRGTQSVSVDGAAQPQLVVFWDLTAARYDASLEPHSGYYFVAVAGADVVLAVGDLAAEFVEERFEGRIPKAAALTVPFARRERVVAPDPAAMHTARRVRFAEGGPDHEVSVGCSGGGVGGAAEEELWVSVDGKRAVQARRPRLNFRGNQTVFVDGAPVDVMWDLHGWWFREPPYGSAVVMLRARSALESRLWLEEEEVATAVPGFSLVLQAFKSRADGLSSAPAH